MRAHQYLYYVECCPVLSDIQYDKFCRDNNLDGGGGSDRITDYTLTEINLAQDLKNEN